MKITLANLHEATAQQVFDQAAAHLLEQNSQSLIEYNTGTRAAYRGGKAEKDGKMCPAGCFIDDSEYDPCFERIPWLDLVQQRKVPPAHGILIAELQAIHDKWPPSRWKGRLYVAGKLFNLNLEILNIGTDEKKINYRLSWREHDTSLSDADHHVRMTLAWNLINSLTHEELNRLFDIQKYDPRQRNGDLDSDEYLKALHRDLSETETILYTAKLDL